MTFAGFIIFVLCILACGLGIHKFKLRRQRVMSQQGLLVINKLTALLSLLQQHRWLRIQMHSAEKQDRHVLGVVQAQIGDAMDTLNEYSDIKQDDRWRGLRDHWQRFRISQTLPDAHNDFLQHNNMVNILLYLIEETAQQRLLNKQQLICFPNIALLWRELPLLVDYMWQATTLTLSLAEPNVRASVQLNKHIRQLSRTVFHHVRYNGPASAEKERLIQQANQSCKQFTHQYQQWCLPDVSQNELAAQLSPLASQSIDNMQALFDFELEQIRQELTR